MVYSNLKDFIISVSFEQEFSFNTGLHDYTIQYTPPTGYTLLSLSRIDTDGLKSIALAGWFFVSPNLYRFGMINTSNATITTNLIVTMHFFKNF